MTDFNISTLKLEGQLYKYTNVMRGYQYRYFVVDPILGKLDYFMSGDVKTQRPRCSIQLHGAICNPSDEDSTTFMVYTSDNELYKLRAHDAKERQHWVNVIRIVAQAAQAPDTFKSSPTQNGHSKSTGDIKAATKIERLNEDNGDDVNILGMSVQLISEILTQVHSSELIIEKAISALPSHSAYLSKFDKDVLLLKALAKSSVSSLTECCNILSVSKGRKRQTFSGLNNADLDNSFMIRSNRANTVNPVDYTTSTQKPIASAHTSATTFAQPSAFVSHIAININHDDEISDEELTTGAITQTPTDSVEYNQIFEENKSQILSLLSNLKLGMDLTKVKLPTFILEKRSLLELFADCLSHPSLFVSIGNDKTPEDRILSVLDWYLTSFHQIRKESLNKKPFNPVLGETFHCSWNVPPTSESSLNQTASINTLVTYCAEQVSHHPPITAFYLECEERKMKLNASIYTQSKFLGMSIGVSLIGKLNLRLSQYNEDYVMTLPSCYARSILTQPWMELGDKVSITCPQTGYNISIIFHVKPFYGGYSNQVSAEVRNKNEEVICKVQGTWDGKLEYQYFNNKPNKTIDTCTLKVDKKRVRPLAMQDKMESRRVWCNVSQALNKGDLASATAYKDTVEAQQRKMEKLRNDDNIEYKAKYFTRNVKDDEWLHQNWIMPTNATS